MLRTDMNSNRFFSEGVRNLMIGVLRSEEHTSELQSQSNLVCRLLLEIIKRLLEEFLGMLHKSHQKDSLAPIRVVHFHHCVQLMSVFRSMRCGLCRLFLLVP